MLGVRGVAENARVGPIRSRDNSPPEPPSPPPHDCGAFRGCWTASNGPNRPATDGKLVGIGLHRPKRGIPSPFGQAGGQKDGPRGARQTPNIFEVAPREAVRRNSMRCSSSSDRDRRSILCTHISSFINQARLSHSLPGIGRSIGHQHEHRDWMHGTVFDRDRSIDCRAVRRLAADVRPHAWDDPKTVTLRRHPPVRLIETQYPRRSARPLGSRSGVSIFWGPHGRVVNP